MSQSATKKGNFSRPLGKGKKKKPISLDSYRLLDSTLRRAITKLAQAEIANRYKDILTNTWNKETRSVIVRSLKDLGQVGGAVTQQELQLIERNIEDALGVPLATAQANKIIRVNEGNWLNTRGAVESELGVTLGWNLPDKAALDLLDRETFFWIGNHYDTSVQSRIQGRLGEYFEGGLNRNDLMLRLRHDFEAEFARSDSYWDLLANHTSQQVREMSRVAHYEQAGVEVVRVNAELDDKTSDICRSLHGQIIEVKDLRRMMDKRSRATLAGDPEKIKAAQPWWSDKQANSRLNSQGDVNRQVNRGNIGLPPYHARCRTRTVAEFKADAGTRSLTDQDIASGARVLDDDRPIKDTKDPRPKGRKKKLDSERAQEVDWANKSVSSVKTATHAKSWFEARHAGTVADFTGITEARAIERILRPQLKELDRLFKAAPEVAKTVKYVGTQQGKSWTAFRRTLLRDAEIPINPTTIKQSLRDFKMADNTYAHAFKYQGATIQGIGMNAKWYNQARRLEDAIKENIKAGHFFKGTNTTSIITHEFGHSIRHYIRDVPLGGQRKIRAFDAAWGHVENVSAYAETKLTESWAESFAANFWGTAAHKANPYVKEMVALMEDILEIKFKRRLA